MTEDQKPSIMNMVLFSKPISITKGNIEKTAKASGFDGLRFLSEDDDEEVSLLLLNDMPFMLMSQDFPVPEDAFAGALDFSLGEEDRGAIVKSHNAHVIISPMATPEHMGESIMAAIGLTQLSGLISNMGETSGHFWSVADVLVSHAKFAQNINDMHAGLAGLGDGAHNSGDFLPLTMWLGIKLTRLEITQQFGGITSGLDFFTGYELEIAPNDLLQQVTVQRLHDFAKYLFSNGPVFNDGETIKISDDEVYSINHIDGDAQHSGRVVMSLLKGDT